MDLKQIIRDFPDFPRPGILFRDITTILKDPAHFRFAIEQIEEQLEGIEYDLVIAPEARGIMFGAPIAARQKKGFVPARKKGKLPGEVVRKTYFLEYGLDAIEIHKDAIKPGQKVVIIDDLLATGGTAKGICDIVEELGGQVVCIVFLIELCAIKGGEILKDYDVRTVLKY
ncbi:MAG: adenine phosphoribosyltransferase [Clostridiales bacterium]|jgi:adenine phosphoribosyltransferase|nr:adenine phosphoribosyltransferase [Clostridiales bacterium]